MNSRKLFGRALCAISVLLTSSAVALGQNAPATQGVVTGNGEGSLPLFSETTADPSQAAGGCDVGFDQPRCCPRWTASAEVMILERIGSVPYTLVEMVPIPPLTGPGTEMLNARDLHQGFSGGPRLGLIHHGDDGNDLEVSYFQIDGWDVARGVGPTPNNLLVMTAPGDFSQNQDGDKATQFMAWDYASRLYNAEVNVRRNPWRGLTVLAGFRWINLSEELQGLLAPPNTNGAGTFWDTQTKNNLYGFQIGMDAKLLERNRFSIDGVVKAGIFDNHVDEATAARMTRIQFGESASTDHAAFVGEIGLQAKYQLTQRLLLKAGYEAIWLQGVALAPGQIAETYCHGSLVPQEEYVQALGVNCNSGAFYHGATAGLEFSF